MDSSSARSTTEGTSTTEGIAAPHDSPAGAASRDNAHALHLVLFRHVERTLGRASLDDVVARAGVELTLDDLLDPTGWCSYEDTRRLLEACADVLGGIDAFCEGAAYYDSGTVTQGAGEMLSTFRSLGGPAGILRDVAATASKFSSVVVMEPGEITDVDGVVTARTVRGFAPYRLLCELTAGLLSVTSRVFGLPPAHVVEERCAARGDDVCTFRVSWDVDADPNVLADQRQHEVACLQDRFSSLRSTVAELVSGHDVDTVLERVVERAAHAVRAPRYLLAVRIHDDAPLQVHAIGFGADEAERTAAELLEGSWGRDPSRLVVDIRSGERNYGRLAVFNAEGATFFDEERSNLAAYGELTAAALDSATALAEAKLQSHRAQSLLDLAHALAEVTTRHGVANKLAAAVPSVVGSASAAVMVWDGERLVAAAAEGVTPEVASAFTGFAVRLEDAELLRAAVERGEPYFLAADDAEGELRDILAASGTKAVVLVPIRVGDELHGVVSAGVTSDFARLHDDHDLVARLSGVAALAATAFENAQLLERLQHQSLHDALTEMPNQRLLEDRVDIALAAMRRSGAPAALLYLDLDRFKHINDTLGHTAGDQLIIQIARRLATAVREVDTVARLGGDEFAVLLPALADPADAELVAAKLLSAMREPFQIEGHHLFVTASIGIAVASGTDDTYASLAKAADAAMYAAKSVGPGTHRLYSPSMSATDDLNLRLQTELHAAVRRGQLSLEFQPVVEPHTMQVVGAEALVRWVHPRLGVIEPDIFLPLAEATGLITDIDAWVLGAACEQLATWQAAGLVDLSVSVNVSLRELRDARFPERVRAVLAATGIDAAALEIEFTQRVADATGDEVEPVLDALRASGVRIAIDDFGIGTSAFKCLLGHRVDTLKIDRSFLHTSSTGADAAALVVALVSVGHSLGLTVVAEGVETVEHLALARQAGFDLVQGFYCARPVDTTAFEQLARAWTRSPTSG